jgi:hypothetical protein
MRVNKAFQCLLTIVFVLLYIGCSSGTSAHRIDKSRIDENDRTFVLLNNTPWDHKIISSMAVRNFKIKKFASTKQVIQDTSTGKEIFNPAEARYGIRVTCRRIDYCLWNANEKIDLTYEISDISSNDVILIVSTVGWTGSCGPSFGEKDVFESMSKAMVWQWTK